MARRQEIDKPAKPQPRPVRAEAPAKKPKPVPQTAKKVFTDWAMI